MSEPVAVGAGAALAGLRVLELGSRLAVGACGRLLADLGASVFLVEPRLPTDRHKWRDRALAAAGKRSVLCDPVRNDDVALIAALTRRCDVALLSSDIESWPPALAQAVRACPIVCDISAFGSTGPLAGQAADDATIQAMSGLMDTTGPVDGAALPIGVPIVELSAGAWAASAVVVAAQVLARDGVGQAIDIALFDTAINALTTFLPGHFAGKAASRLGNGHSMCAPWNAYMAADGWVLMCSATDPHWLKIAELIDPALAREPRYAALTARVELRAEVDALVSAWVRHQKVEPLVAALSAVGVACGAIVPIARLADEPNLALRRAIATVVEPQSGHTVKVPGALIRFDADESPPPVIAAPDDGRTAAAALTPRERRAAGTAGAPYAGLRVLEIGQFTTAPLVARHLASFGADVIKIEPIEGDSARGWAPHRDGTSHFFIMSNGEKRSLALDLRDLPGRERFAALVTDADVLVENMKPGSLERLGFGAERLRAINPRLVYCAISGFGVRSVYAGRPAFDTVAQAMSGLMDATHNNGVPMKSGISAADIGGGQMGLLAIVAALVRRERSGRGSAVEIAMQDVGAWLTQTRWNRPAQAAHPGVPVATVAQAACHPQTLARELIVRRRDAAGTEWELLASPLRLQATPPRVGMPLGLPHHGAMHWKVVAASADTPERS
ncbi:MAG: CoA transferase [Burkholderiaceae bacterium]|nr:CoA transferase [Burkholderiaceae bacterium]